jgi:hypothetical protein
VTACLLPLGLQNGRYFIWWNRMLVVLICESQKLLEIGRQEQSALWNERFIHLASSLSCWLRSFVCLHCQDIHSANTSRSSGLSECSHCSFDWCSFHTVNAVKFRTLLGSLVQGVYAASRTLFGVVVTTVTMKDTRNGCNRCVHWGGKHKRAELFLRSVSVSSVFSCG